MPELVPKSIHNWQRSRVGYTLLLLVSSCGDPLSSSADEYTPKPSKYISIEDKQRREESKSVENMPQILYLFSEPIETKSRFEWQTETVFK